MESNDIIVQEERLPSTVICVLAEEHICWMGFVGSFLMMVIAMLFLHCDELLIDERLLSWARCVDLFMLISSIIAAFRYLYLYIRSWHDRRFGNDEDDDNHRNTSVGIKLRVFNV